MYKPFKVAFLFSALIFSSNIYADTDSVDECHEQFQPLTVSEIQNIFSDENNYEKYKGQKGYILFAQKNPNIDNMADLFKLVAEALGREFNKLRWKKYSGSSERMQEEREQILDEHSQLKAEYLGMTGYGRYATNYHAGDMDQAYENVKSVLSWGEFKKIKWRKYPGSSEEFQTERSQILNNDGHPKAEYFDMVGFSSYAAAYHGGDMLQAYKNVLIVLGRAVFDGKLGWRKYQGFTEEFQKERKQILNDRGHLKTEYLGRAGYSRYATDYHGGRMNKAYESVLVILGSKAFNRLGWRKYQGSSEEFQTERSQILENNSYLKIEYLDMGGYIKYAEDYHEGDMLQAYEGVRVALGRTVIDRELGWRQYYDSSKRFQKESRWILDANDEPREEYRGMNGYSEYATAYYKGNMELSYRNVLAILGQDAVDRELAWRRYEGFSGQFQKEKNRILDTSNYPKDKYLGMNGYISYAKQYYGGDMRRAYQNIWSVFGSPGMEFLGFNWIKFYGTALECQNLLQFFRENAITEFEGVEGQRKVAQIIFEEDNRYTDEDRLRNIYGKVFNLAEVLLGSKEAFRNLNWLSRLK